MALTTALLLPGMVLGGLLIFGGDEKKPTPKPPGPGAFDKPALDAITEVRLVQGVGVRYFKRPVADALCAMMRQCYLTPSELTFTGEVGEKVKCYDLVPFTGAPEPGKSTAYDVATSVATHGLAVLGTLNLPNASDPAPRTIALVHAEMRLILAAASVGTPFAVLLDPGQSPGTPPTVLTPPVMPPTTPPTMPPTMPPGPPAPPDWDPGMPASVRKEVEKLLTSTSTSPDTLEQAADDLEPKYPIAAAKLRARASELRELQQMRDTKLGGTPHQIRYGDLASLIAQHYTGEASRWTEIAHVPLNKGMKNTPAGPVPWKGTVYLPLAWRCWQKGLPPVAKGAPKVAEPPAEPEEKLPTAEQLRRRAAALAKLGKGQTAKGGHGGIEDVPDPYIGAGTAKARRRRGKKA